MRVAVIGAMGQLGTEVAGACEAAGHAVIRLGHADLDVDNTRGVASVLRDLRPDVVVNCAAYVKVDGAESQPTEAFRVNAVGALHVARACGDLGIMTVYMSSDFVFDGRKGSPYSEDDRPAPINVYGASKLAGELLVAASAGRSLIVRTAGLFGRTPARGKGGNFVDTIVAKVTGGEQVRVVADVRTSPSYAADVAQALLQVLRDGATGLVHLVNAGNCTWHEFATEIVRLMSRRAALEPISQEQYLYSARRPRDSSLTSIRIGSHVQALLRPWQDAVHTYMLAKGYI